MHNITKPADYKFKIEALYFYLESLPRNLPGEWQITLPSARLKRMWQERCMKRSRT